MDSGIANYIRRQRRTWGLSQAEVARLLGISSHSRIGKIEAGTSVPNAKELLGLQAIFGMTGAQLFPLFDNEIRETVARGARAMQKSIDPTVPRAYRKNTLLGQILSRAVTR